MTRFAGSRLKSVEDQLKETMNSGPEYEEGYGERIDLPAGAVGTADFIDKDKDGIDDRYQPGPGQPRAPKNEEGSNPQPQPQPQPQQPITTPSTGNRNPYLYSPSNPSGIKTSGDLNPYLSSSTTNPVKVPGDNNTTNVDNSINQNTYDMSDNRRYYGGSSRTFNYTGGDGLSQLYDSPVSKATMGGFYDVDDSPAAAASFLDRYIGMNNLYQNETKKNYEKTANFDYSRSTAAGVDYAAMYDNIQNTINRNKASSRAALDRIFGEKTALINMNKDQPAEIEFSIKEDDDDEE